MFPWNLNGNLQEYIKQFTNVKPNEVEDFIKKILSSHVPFQSSPQTDVKSREQKPSTLTNKEPTKNPTSAQHKNEPIEIKVFESHEDVFVHFPLNNKNDIKTGKIFYNSNQLILKDIPNIGDKHKVLLPAIVQQRGAKINYKNGILQIKIPKADDLQFTEIDLNL
ncbi:hypothetical protein M670_03531 [Schinkia azotoformans MEV2011]|uniref:Molecular chaperone (Small heat shock protein) n=1 Tax=Schinkia azotoformans MEV2011 TaxID=1348973 RepID=A0A072NHV9_SCHAZ|nr:hypothetical protein [Schinkia azotoformans]KEF37284.1 hypothetical protein M670_03531 [Schinkia azotoformans MEV2011]MEC1718479.1 hypothetical protein [Schinkia azotoformans]MEC1743649.1 hypothetical protein [Schinkia azotoformans]MEC1748179.1 hypothetical protein [Schinkia azotoformans]MEC1760633.1 hypothetical protein [Schinkia azotoformans]